MGPDLITWATLFGLIVMPLATLAWGIHIANIRARAGVEKQRRRANKRLFLRLDHLDQCIDDVRERVTQIEAKRMPRRVRTGRA